MSTTWPRSDESRLGNTPLGPGGVRRSWRCCGRLLIPRTSSWSIRSTSDFARVHILARPHVGCAISLSAADPDVLSVGLGGGPGERGPLKQAPGDLACPGVDLRRFAEVTVA